MDNTVDVSDRFPEPAEMTPVEFEADRCEATLVVGVRVGGRKVQEIPIRFALLYPFDLETVLQPACEQARKQWEAQQNA